jgi:hypothetical protein
MGEELRACPSTRAGEGGAPMAWSCRVRPSIRVGGGNRVAGSGGQNGA